MIYILNIQLSLIDPLTWSNISKTAIRITQGKKNNDFKS
jgi:hypothetical protein